MTSARLQWADINPYLYLRNSLGDVASGSNFMYHNTHDRPRITMHAEALPPFDGDEFWQVTPARTAVIPVELSELPSNVEAVLSRLRRACHNLGRTEVVLWFNSDASDIAVSMTRYHAWAQWLETVRSSREFRLHAVHRFRAEGENFSGIRSNYMDAVIMSSVGRAISLDHKVWWLDANMPFIGRDAIVECENAVDLNLGHFVKANLIYVGEEPSNRPLSDRSDAEKVAAVYAFTRRQLEWNLGPTDARGYVEEPGMVMTLRSYIASGGIATTNPLLGESRTMLRRANGRVDSAIPLVHHVRSARIGKTSRRFRVLAERYPAWKLAGSEEGDDYVSYTTLVNQDVPLRSDRVTVDEVREMVRRMIAAQYRRTGSGLTEAQAVRNDMFIAQCGFTNTA